MPNLRTLVGISLVLAGCDAGDGTSSSGAIGRSFDELAASIKGCAETLGRCRGDRPDASARCREQFLKCRASAGRPAEADLTESVGYCREGLDACQEDSDALMCDRELHACIGEAAPPTAVQQGRSRSMPDAHAPTYQCFGQLRECVASGSAPSECAAQARACVIEAVGEVPEG
jgi:hypothetical protein